jgi:UDP-N-acetylmuramate dehydrogenase
MRSSDVTSLQASRAGSMAPSNRRGSDDFARVITSASGLLGIDAMRDVPIAPFTSLKVGGSARYMVRARTPDEIIAIASLGAQYGMAVLVLGGGSNVVVADAGFDGLVIKVDAPYATRHSGTISETDGDAVIVHVEAGCQTAGFARWAARKGLAGVEWACGIPGSVGGAVAGNAGAYGGDMASVVNEVQAWVPCVGPATTKVAIPGSVGKVIDVSTPDMAYGYRTSRFKGGSGVVLGARLRLRREDPEAVLARIDKFEAARRQKQPTERSCGSMFRNPPGEVAGRLLEQAGMKGRSRGDAQVSPVHANWIVNRGRAAASDVISLVREGRAAVFARTGIRLRLEVLLVGAWNPDETADLLEPLDRGAEEHGPNHDTTEAPG